MRPLKLAGCDGACGDSPEASVRRAFLRRVLGCAAGALTFGCLTGVEVVAIEPSTPVLGGERRYPLPEGDGVTVDQSSSVMLVRYQGKVMALALACPHQRAAVRWLPSEQRFQCSKHDSKYQPNGTYTSGRATRNLDRFPIHRDGQSVVVDLTMIYKSDQDTAGWAAAVVSL
jgi:nitrite reductase/ring-hydroxylating ferredoxin subunit